MLLIKNGHIVPMSAHYIEGGDILIDNGIIVDVGQNIDYAPKRTDDVIDASDCFVFPGFIDAHSQVGIALDGIGDLFMLSNPITPNLSVINSIKYDDPVFYECLRAGITSVVVAPFERNIVGGKCALIKTAQIPSVFSGKADTSHIVSGFCAMKFSLAADTQNHESNLALRATMLKNDIQAAKSYFRERKTANTAFFESPTLESYEPILNREIPVYFYVKTAEELKMALRISKQFNFTSTIVGCNDCERVDEALLIEIREYSNSIVLGPCITRTSKGFEFAKQLSENKMPFALSTAYPRTNIQYLPMIAGLSVRDGVPIEKAFAAITINAAIACRAFDKIGSIEVGKQADIAIFDANPLEVFTKTLYTIVNGRIAYKIEE